MKKRYWCIGGLAVILAGFGCGRSREPLRIGRPFFVSGVYVRQPVGWNGGGQDTLFIRVSGTTGHFRVVRKWRALVAHGRRLGVERWDGVYDSAGAVLVGPVQQRTLFFYANGTAETKEGIYEKIEF